MMYHEQIEKESKGKHSNGRRSWCGPNRFEKEQSKEAVERKTVEYAGEYAAKRNTVERNGWKELHSKEFEGIAFDGIAFEVYFKDIGSSRRLSSLRRQPACEGI